MRQLDTTCSSCSKVCLVNLCATDFLWRSNMSMLSDQSFAWVIWADNSRPLSHKTSGPWTTCCNARTMPRNWAWRHIAALLACTPGFSFSKTFKIFFFGRNPFVWSDLGLSFFWRWMNWTWTTTGDWRTNIRQLFVTGTSIEEAPHFNALSEWSEMNGLWNAGGLRKNQDLGKIKKGPWLQEGSTQGSRFPCVCHWSSFRSPIVGRKPISGCCRTGENRTHSFVCALMSFFLNLLKKFEYVWTCYGFGLLSTLPHISFRFDALVLLLRCHIFLRVFARRSEIPWSWLCHLQRMICKGTVWALIGLSLGLLLLRLFNPFFVHPFASWVLKKNNQKRRI